MFQSYTNIHIRCWAPGCTGQKCKGTGLLLLQFYAVYWEIKCNTVCHVCLSVIQQGCDPAHRWCLCWSNCGPELKPEQDQCPRGPWQTAPGSIPRNTVVLCSGFSWLWSVWETWSKITCSWEFRYKSVPIVPFCNMQIIMNICIFLHFCVWYMYYLRQML